MREEGILATQDHFIITLTPFNHEALIYFDTNLTPHFLPNVDQGIFINYLDIELDYLLLRVVRIFKPEI